MNVVNRWAVVLLLGSGAVSASAGIRILPLIEASVAGGESRYEAEESRFKGRASFSATPVVEFSDRLAVLPTLRGSYAGVQTAIKIADEGTLFQQEQNYEGEVKLLYRWTPRFKTSLWAGGVVTWLKETTDEGWRDGLYDHRSFLGGGEVETFFPFWRWPSLFRIGVEYSRVHFPNYITLASQSGDSLMGARVLDVDNLILSINGRVSVSERLQWHSSLTGVYVDYPDQKVIGDQGFFSGKKRSDWYWILGQGVDYLQSFFRAEVSWALDAEVSRRDSNQNYMDVGDLRFFSDYYDYRETSATPSVQLRMKPRNAVLSLGARFSRRLYLRRPSQSVDGSYASKKMSLRESTYFAGLSLSVIKHVRGFLNGEWGTATSNTDFEGLYRYKYNTRSVQTGMTFEF